MNTRTTVFAALFAFATAGTAAEIGQLTSIDPLTLPAPTMLEPMRFAPDPRSPAEKIQPALWEEALKANADATIPVIVSLHDPLLPEDLRGTTAEADSYRVQWVASLAHNFALKASATGLTELRAISHFPALFGRIKAKDLVGLAALPGVLSIAPDENRPWTRVQGGSLVKADILRSSFGGTGLGSDVAVLDSGATALPELIDAVEVVGNYSGVGGPSDITDNVGHGTACIGIVAGRSLGMARAADIWAIKVGDQNGVQDSNAIAALNALYAGRASFGGLDVISMSFGGGPPRNSSCDSTNPTYASIISTLASAGVSIFVSSGNDGFGDGVTSPSCFSGAVAVGAVYDANIGPATFSNCSDPSTAADQIPCYSNSGVPLAILAPAHCAETTGPMGSCFGGTSAAAPYAAGVAAQILSARPGTTAAQLRSALVTTGRPRTDVNGITRNRIDALQAYQALGGTSSGPCVQNATTLCLLGDRFEVKATYTDYSNNTGPGQAVELTPDSGYFWFFDASNVEAVGKVVSFCPVNGSFGFYAGGLTDVGVVMTVRDTVANQTQTFTNNRGHNFDMISSAFNTCAQ